MRYIFISVLLVIISTTSWGITPDAAGVFIPDRGASPIHRACDLEEMDGWPQTMGISGVGPGGGLKAYDLDADGESEIISGSTDGMLYVWNLDGTPQTGFPVSVTDYIRSAVAIGNINSTPQPEIIVTTVNGLLCVYDYTGTLLPGFPRELASGFTFNAPLLWDFDNDGQLEIIASDDSLYAILGDGSDFPGFPVNINSLYGTVATPAVGDIDFDQVVEIVVEGWDSLFVFDAYGQLQDGWPVGLSEDYDGFSYSAPVLVDFDGNDSLEIIAGYHESGGGDWAGKAAVWSCTGELYDGWWPVSFYGTGSWTYSTPAVGDIDMDGEPEFVMTSHNGRISVRNGDGTSPTPWPVSTIYYNMECSAVIGDINTDGLLEIVVATNGAHYYVLAFDTAGMILDTFPLTSSAAMTVNTPFIGDLNGDGYIELISTGIDGMVHLWQLPGEYVPGTLPWPQAHHDPWNTGWYHPDPPDSFRVEFIGDAAWLSWNEQFIPDLTGYNLYRSFDMQGLNWTRLNEEPITGIAFVDSTLISDTSAYYFITGLLESGHEGHRSAIIGTTMVTSITNRTLPHNLEFSVFPNPFNSIVTFSIQVESAGNYFLQLFDINGREVNSWEFNLNKGASATRHWQPDFGSSSLYFWELRGPGGPKMGKLVYLK
ncbi:T9SS type A sorting domain-containing protein [bacterium]|nr:T9SS type A sorting domain-containing protein [bacterium]